ncbi:bifunctional helix-turn-helix transcriptional regulator/GNAT family N-acetyltransferase [Pararhodospirillum oryzae]|uniref:MarR family transcriptional regulator n=1 Tax=Pararhodospirillum oryzae TaxID=478448 RepID=A0A512H4H4_9PROT|nr:helix-turn-helix domain-containing GNAT family N-acetyltransferase [Pararhodospirillum oryzae]GEO80352.1 MarR family transcriptional regulator [Pararhodospirillum oryzae]
MSRRFVRELGFMGGDFAGTDWAPSFVHALIEIEAGGVTARDLSAALRLEKSTISRMVRKLIAFGVVAEQPGAADARTKVLSLTPAGRQRVAEIHAFARAQVNGALARLRPGQERVVLEGLRLYTTALAGEAPEAGAPAPVTIAPGYRTALIARITHLHATYYARVAGFGRRFEAVVAGGLAAFCDRLDHPDTEIWTALINDEIVGSIAIDGQDLGSGRAHLRWFIVADGARGLGVGRGLLATALAFVDARAFAQTDLWTFSGLDAARHLYEAHGFALVEEFAGSQWGQEVREQHFVRKSPEKEALLFG